MKEWGLPRGCLGMVVGMLTILPTIVSASFYVCPAPCKAMYLPVDMKGVDDCMCAELNTDGDNNLSAAEVAEESALKEHGRRLFNLFTFHCPENSAATVVGPSGFEECICNQGYTRYDKEEQCLKKMVCEGRYRLREGLTIAKSIADCTCESPYTKDDTTGECYLSHCPRSGNYVKKEGVKTVTSLVDCTCIKPFVKNEQSGACYVGYQCPAHSQSLGPGSLTTSFKDCTCEIGYIKISEECVAEQPKYKCPTSSAPKTSLKGQPQNFNDCVCKEGYSKVEKEQKCVPLPLLQTERLESNFSKNTLQFQCPKYSLSLAPIPQSMEQCMCFPGFVPNLTTYKCDWNPNSYRCPNHSFNPHPEIPVVEFSDCQCVKGYMRDEAKLECIKTGGFNCPASSIIKSWPVHNFNDCHCTNGVAQMGGALENASCNPSTNDFQQCPIHSVIQGWPVLSPSDCRCVNGYSKDLNIDRLECQQNDPIDFKCPAHAILKPATTLAKSIDDCQCTEGRKLCPFDLTCKYLAEQVKSANGKVDKLVINGKELDYFLVDDNIMITQGDIAVGVEIKIDEDLKLYLLNGFYDENRDHRWKNSHICYLMSSDLGRTQVEGIDWALAQISTNTGFTFQDCGEGCGTQLGCEDYLVFNPTRSGCYSFVGRIGGEQTLGLSKECSKGHILHEILHAMGLHHPVVRKDRDEHIQIVWDCIRPEYRNFFVIEDSHTPHAPYDFYSVMHHPHHAFADPEKKTCMSILSRVQNETHRHEISHEMGQREQMSLADIHYVWELYPELKTSTQQKKMRDVQLHHTSRVQPGKTRLQPQATKNMRTFWASFFCFLAVIVFGLFMVFEYQRRQTRGKDGDIYSDPLLQDDLKYAH